MTVAGKTHDTFTWERTDKADALRDRAEALAAAGASAGRNGTSTLATAGA